MRTMILVALLSCAGAVAGYAQGNPEAASKIVAMEHVWAQAYIVKDPRALARILDDAFVCVASDGKLMSKAEVMADVKTSTALQILTEPMVVHMHGDAAIVTGTFRTKGVERGKPYARRERFVDTWVNKNGQWVSVTTMVTLAAE
jgi:ketosteroid isomerase-like protein